VAVWPPATLSANAAPSAHHVFIISFDQSNPDWSGRRKFRRSAGWLLLGPILGSHAP